MLPSDIGPSPAREAAPILGKESTHRESVEAGLQGTPGTFNKNDPVLELMNDMEQRMNAPISQTLAPFQPEVEEKALDDLDLLISEPPILSNITLDPNDPYDAKILKGQESERLRRADHLENLLARVEEQHPDIPHGTGLPAPPTEAAPVPERQNTSLNDPSRTLRTPAKPESTQPPPVKAESATPAPKSEVTTSSATATPKKEWSVKKGFLASAKLLGRLAAIISSPLTIPMLLVIVPTATGMEKLLGPEAKYTRQSESKFELMKEHLSANTFVGDMKAIGYGAAGVATEGTAQDFKNFGKLFSSAWKSVMP